MSLSPRSTLKRPTSVEKKVLASILTPHHNDLRAKDGDPSETSIISSQSFKLSPHLSVIQHMGQFWEAIREDDCSSSSSLDLQQLLMAVPDGETIELPPEHIILDKLHIQSSLTLHGSSATTLEIRGGSIFVSNTSGSRIKVLISELNIVYKATKAAQSPFSLFVLEGSELNVEAQDCSFKSESPLNDFAKIEDACFFVKESTQFSSVLLLKSCQISNFFEAVHAAPNSRILIERSHI